MNTTRIAYKGINLGHTNIHTLHGLAIAFIAVTFLQTIAMAEQRDRESVSQNKSWDSGPIGSDVSVGDPISATSGNMYYEITDVAIGSDFEKQLEFTRSYNSAGSYDSYPSGLGPNWTHSYSGFIKETSYGSVTLIESTGRHVPFVDFRGPSDLNYRLEYDAENKSYSIIKADNTLLRFNSNGQLEEVFDRYYLRNKLEYKGDKLVKVSDPSDRSLMFSYNSKGRIESIALSDKTTYCTFSYSGAPDYSLTKVTYADSSWESYKYESVGQTTVLMTERCNADGVCQFYTYDQLTRATSNYGNDSVNLVELLYWSSTKGKSDRIFGTTVRGEDTTVYESQFVGNTGRRKLLRKTRIGNPKKGLEQTYDKSGNKTSSKYTEGCIDSLFFDSLSRETHSWTGTDDKGFDTYTMRSFIPSRFNLENIVRTTALKTKNTTVTEFEYDRRGNVIGIIESDLHDLSRKTERTTRLKYNARGQLQNLRDPSASGEYEIRIGYHGNGDIKSVKESNSKTTEYGKRDNLGNPTWVKYPNGSESYFEFDKRGRLVTMREVGPAGNYEITHCEYNYSGKVIRLTLPDSSFVAYNYDNHGWLIEVNSSVYGTTIYEYDKYGHIIDKLIVSPQGDTLTSTASESVLN